MSRRKEPSFPLQSVQNSRTLPTSRRSDNSRRQSVLGRSTIICDISIDLSTLGGAIL
jgi:hypothetical protein